MSRGAKNPPLFFMRENALDTYGKPACRVYNFGRILADNSFEQRLKCFDPNLKLVFDNTRQRWTILEWALDNSGWNIVMRAQDDEGNPKPLGEWMLNQLYVWRHNNSRQRDVGIIQWEKESDYEMEKQKAAILAGHSREFRGRIVDNINQFRRGHKEMINESTADVTAGYPKVTYTKGELNDFSKPNT